MAIMIYLRINIRNGLESIFLFNLTKMNKEFFQQLPRSIMNNYRISINNNQDDITGLKEDTRKV